MSADQTPAPGLLRCGSHAAKRILRCRRGTYMLEFSAVAGGLLTILFGAVELAWQGVTAAAMENAVLQASRTGSLGCLQPDGSRAGQASAATILEDARTAGSGILNGNSLRIAMNAYGTLQQAGLRTGGTLGAGSGGQTVVYTLTYDAPLLFVGGFLGKSSYTHTGTVTVRNEPFSAGGASAAPC